MARRFISRNGAAVRLSVVLFTSKAAVAQVAL
jgi:hypothetical protein